MAFEGFGKNSGPALPPKAQPSFGNFPSYPSPPNPNPSNDNNSVAAERPQRQQQAPSQPEMPAASPPRWGNQRKQSASHVYPTNHQRLPTVATHVTANDVETKFPTKPINLHVTKRMRSPSLPSRDDDFLEDYRSSEVSTRRLRADTDTGIVNGNAEPPKRRMSPFLAFESNHSAKNFHFSHEETQRSDVSPPRLGSQRKSPFNDANLIAHQRFPTVEPFTDTGNAGTLSPPKPTSFNAPKRTRSPPLPSPDVSLGASSSVQLDSEREMQAKAKRLARFSVELSQPISTLHDLTRHKSSGNKYNQAPVEKQNFDNPSEEERDLADGSIMSDHDGLGSSTAVLGLCPDMCPESEREERERKGDLDKYERLDGERNQTSKFLAVKKYNRTAEREADLIRPMPVLQKTVDYLLDLLDQPYDANFLGMYNFLWDRMRAIRMDLRMQHIFNQDAITMLEQMIRLHIIAMHELCEYTKGEGFSEGFDAHLNIEQMNKTSVELFQMYDDHRKKGISVPTEKEFRGYYALLKLDKHPGYKVEPAELSLDLAKMTPEIRYTPEILFARNVARACRTGNFIAFFRLARKATYLQACLMHAHFAKLRTQALASLHSGLQNNQGIPIPLIVKWLGMEGEDIESLLEYHGFLIKNFEDPYMVKEGPFLTSDMDFTTKCSQLVQLKKSKRIMDDVYSGQTLSCFTEERKIASDMVDQRSIGISGTEAWVNVVDEEMLDHQVDSAPAAVAQPLLEGLSSAIPNSEREGEIMGVYLIDTSLYVDDSVGSHTTQAEEEQMVESDVDTPINGITLPKVKGNIVQTGVSGSSKSYILENLVPQRVAGKSSENEAVMLIRRQENEAATDKLKLIIRRWKLQSSKKREIREQKQFLANVALSSLSLGPPIRQSEEQPSHASGELNIDYVARERHGRHEKSWSRLNVSELVTPVLSARNPDAKCICWKVLILVQANDTKSQTYQLGSKWLHSKLMGSGKENDDELVVCSSHLSIWKKWVGNTVSFPQTCCLSAVREMLLENTQPVSIDDSVAGTSCIMFLVSESIPWDTQRVRLHNLLVTIPSGSNLPLLIVGSDMYKEGIRDSSLTIINRLGLHDVDKTKINSYSVVFLVSDYPVEHINCFFNDDHLREGLQWLANQSPLQPALRQVKTREMVLSYLGYSLKALDNLNTSEVGPDHCILAFNEALDRLAERIITAAAMNPICWPGPEIDLLEKSSNEWIVANMFLPTTGWSSATRIEPLVRAIESCKLPSFSNNMPWLNQGSYMGKGIQNQKLALKECLVSYLTESTQLLNGDLAAREASIMLQKGVGLELHGSCYYIIPRWVMIFRRIYNWRLMNLTGGKFSVAYILENLDDPFAKDSLSKTDAITSLKPSSGGIKDLDNNFVSEGHQPLHSVLTQLNFDEMVEISCSVQSVPQPLSFCRPAILPQGIVHEEGYVSEINSGCKKHDEDLGHSTSVESGDVSLSRERNKQRVAPLSEKRDKLSMLLEQCNRVQNMIDEKLTLYF